LVRDLSIDYTALSLVAPEKVHFKYQLAGQDPDWREVINERQVQYSNLAPGKYRFRVIASNNSGVWNEQGAALDFSIAPAYWQTGWFRALCVAAILALLWMLYRLRMRQLAHEFDMKVEARVDERTRIARELHDTLLQSFNGLLLRFRTVHALFSKSPDQARTILENAIDETRQALTEGRLAVQGLRSSAVGTHEFIEAIKTLTEALASDPAHSGGAEVRLNVEGTPRKKRPLIRDEIYRIASEALRNAFRHAEASRIEVQLSYGEKSFELRVRDDGKGIDPKFLTDEGPAGHFGLRGMRERAQQIGGTLTVWSAPGSGTELVLSVPGAIAYDTAENAKRSWLARALTARPETPQS
jgi:signal transduction histidine kinase